MGRGGGVSYGGSLFPHPTYFDCHFYSHPTTFAPLPTSHYFLPLFSHIPQCLPFSHIPRCLAPLFTHTTIFGPPFPTSHYFWPLFSHIPRRFALFPHPTIFAPLFPHPTIFAPFSHIILYISFCDFMHGPLKADIFDTCSLLFYFEDFIWLISLNKFAVLLFMQHMPLTAYSRENTRI